LKTVNLSLVGLDGNAFSLMGAFQSQARKEHWTEEAIKEVLDEAKEGDYNHLLVVLDSHCEQCDE
jgi:protoheme ferro-lyase